MFTKIMIPVDLAHKDRMTPALDVATGLARSHGSNLILVSVESDQPSQVARNPEEFRQALARMADETAAASGLTVDSHAVICADPAADMSRELLKAAEDSGADLIVMATHMPGLMDHVFTSHGGYVARHAKISVFLIR